MLQVNKIWFFFSISLILHYLIFFLLSQLQISYQNHSLKPRSSPSRLSVTLSTYLNALQIKQNTSPSRPLSILPNKKLYRNQSLLLSNQSTNTFLNPSNNYIEMQSNRETLHNIHDTKYWAQQLSNASESSTNFPLRKKSIPSEPQTDMQKLTKEITQSARSNCRNAYSHMGLLAVPALLFDTTRENGCKW